MRGYLETISSSAAIWVLEHLAPRYRREALAGDLLEQFHESRSLIWLWSRVLQAVSLRIRPITQGGRRSRPAARRAGRYWRDYRGALAFIILMLGFRSAWADWVYVPTGSMNPTVIKGDRLLVDKHVYGLRIPFTLYRVTRGEDPAAGYVITVDSPADGKLLVKRVIGVPAT